MTLEEKIKYVRKYASTQSDIILCSHILTVCDAAIQRQYPLTTIYDSKIDHPMPINPSPDKLFIKRPYLFLPWNGYGVGEQGESCYLLCTKKREKSPHLLKDA